MPEYLSPGVYIEEFEIGAKPIEGVSTSTAGFVGFAERGPLNIPTFVDSFAKYQSIFGAYLPESYGNKRWLPYAVEEFFNNGGQRVFVTRVEGSNADCSEGFLPDMNGGVKPSLAEDVAASGLTLRISDANGLHLNDILYINDGSVSEYIKYLGLAKALKVIPQLQTGNFPKTTPVTLLTPDGTGTFVSSAGRILTISNNRDTAFTPALAIGETLVIDDAEKTEFCTVAALPAGDKTTIRLSEGLKYSNHATTALVKRVKIPATAKTAAIISDDVTAGLSEVPIDSTDTDFITGSYIKIIDNYYKINVPAFTNRILIKGGLKYSHKQPKEIRQLIPAIHVTAANPGEWGNKLKIIIKENSLCNTKLTKSVTGTADSLDLQIVSGIEKGTILKLNATPPVYGTVKEVFNTESTKKVLLSSDISGTFDKDRLAVTSVEFDLTVVCDGTEEKFSNLSMNTDHSRHFEKIITNKTSQLIRVDRTGVTSSSTMPMPNPDKESSWTLTATQGTNDSSGYIESIKGSYDDEPMKRTGLESLKNNNEISIVAAPGITDREVQNSLITHCEAMKNRFAILDPEPIADLTGIQDQRNQFDSKYAALYYPWIQVFDPLSQGPINAPPSGMICGIYARSDNERGVHKAPANEKINGALGLEKLDGTTRIITKGQQDILNPKGINCIRSFPGRGIRVWGARTISSDKLWKYVNVRRLFIYVEESIRENTQWVVFEPNNEKLWGRLKATITEFLTRVWMDGALMGTKPEEAFFVKCDRTTMSQSDIDNGRLICVIGIAPTKPAEFVIFRIAQWQGGSAVTE
jgi:phage tail sheath protein FI